MQPSAGCAVEAPATVRLGETLAYVVALANPTNEDIALAPCPDHEQSLAGVDYLPKPGGMFGLNCAVAGRAPQTGPPGVRTIGPAPRCCFAR